MTRRSSHSGASEQLYGWDLNHETESTLDSRQAVAIEPRIRRAQAEFDPLVLVERPLRCVAPTAWVGHIPFAFWVTGAVNPRLFVELGTHSGNSYCAFCQAVAAAKLSTTCYAVDTWRGDDHAGYYDTDVLAELRSYHDKHYAAFSTLLQSTFDEALDSFEDGTIDLLHIDGCHTYAAVKHDFRAWRRKLTDNAIVLFHDTTARGRSFGVWKLWDELKSEHATFEFSHSHGLGVLAIGDIPPRLAPLFEARGSRIGEIQKLFATVGGTLEESVSTRLQAGVAEKARTIAAGEAAALRRDVVDLMQRQNDAESVTRQIDALREKLMAQGEAVRAEIEAAIGGEAASQATELAAMRTQLAALSSRLAASDAGRDTNAQTIRELRHAYSKAQSNLDDLTAEVARLPAQIAALLAASGEREGAALRGLHEQARSDLDDLKTEIGRLPELFAAMLHSSWEREEVGAALKGLHDLATTGFAALKSQNVDLSRALSAASAADRQCRSRDVEHVTRLLDNAQIESASLRERTHDLVVDATIAWTRYADLLRFFDRLSDSRSPDTQALREAIEAGLLEARRQKALILARTAQPAAPKVGPRQVAEERTPAQPEPPVGSVAVEGRAAGFVRLVVGDVRAHRPRFTVICAADATPHFGSLVESLAASGTRDAIEIFAPQAAEGAFSGGEPVDTGDGELASRIDRLVLDHARSETVAIVSAPGTLTDGWMSGFEAVFDLNPLAAAASGIVVADAQTAAWSGACFGPEETWQLEDRQRPLADYHLASAARLDGLAPGFVAFAVDIYRELGGLDTGGPLASALLAYADKVAEAGFEIYRAPGARMALSAAWRGREDHLVEHFERAACGGSRCRSRRRPRVLVVDAVTPKPDQDAGSVDAYWGMRILSSLGYEVTFIPMYDMAHAGRYTDALRADGVYCPVEPQLTSALHFIEGHGRDYELIVLYRVVVAHLLVDLCRAAAPRAKLVFHTVDLHFLREERAAALLQTPEALAQAQNTRREELRCLGAADAAILVSRHEYDLVGDLVADARRVLVPVMYPVPGRLAPRKGRNGIMFVGGFRHAPNLDAVTYLLDDIWDAIRDQNPELTLSIVGSDPPDSIRDRHDPSRGIEILGFVADLRPLYAKSIVNIAPLRFGAGIKGKIVAALSVGLPVVATSAATEGMGLTDQVDVVVRDDPREIADAVTRLCRDDALWNRISDNGLITAQAEFSVDAQIPRWRALLRSLSLPN